MLINSIKDHKIVHNNYNISIAVRLINCGIGRCFRRNNPYILKTIYSLCFHILHFLLLRS